MLCIELDALNQLNKINYLFIDKEEGLKTNFILRKIENGKKYAMYKL
jgi:hypothetical protein